MCVRVGVALVLSRTKKVHPLVLSVFLFFVFFLFRQLHAGPPSKRETKNQKRAPLYAFLFPEGIGGGEAPTQFPEEAGRQIIGFVPYELRMLVSRRA